jgi:hypothetical protein
MKCLQCHTDFTAVLFQGADGFEVAIFPSVHGGLTTQHTPPGVAYLP